MSVPYLQVTYKWQICQWYLSLFFFFSDYSNQVYIASLKLRVFGHWYRSWRLRRAVAQHQEHMSQTASRFQMRRFFCQWQNCILWNKAVSLCLRIYCACLFVHFWLLIVPATCLCISWTDLLRQFYVLTATLR